MASLAAPSPRTVPIEIAGRDGAMTFKEIAQALGISRVRARELYLKGMNKLRRRLAEERPA